MTIQIEFFGIPRHRAGVDTCSVGAAWAATTLGEIFTELAKRYPRLADACLIDGNLREGFAANLNGDRFLTDSATVIHPGDSLLIMSADAGG